MQKVQHGEMCHEQENVSQSHKLKEGNRAEVWRDGIKKKGSSWILNHRRLLESGCNVILPKGTVLMDKSQQDGLEAWEWVQQETSPKPPSNTSPNCVMTMECRDAQYIKTSSIITQGGQIWGSQLFQEGRWSHLQVSLIPVTYIWRAHLALIGIDVQIAGKTIE